LIWLKKCFAIYFDVKEKDPLLQAHEDYTPSMSPEFAESAEVTSLKMT
jgi:hypothetical protein